MAVSCIKPECTLPKMSQWWGGFFILFPTSSAPSLLQLRGSSLTLFTMNFRVILHDSVIWSGVLTSVGRSHNNTGRRHDVTLHQQSWTTPLLGLQTMFGVKNPRNIFITSRKEIRAIMCAIILWIKNRSKLLLLLGHFCNPCDFF